MKTLQEERLQALPQISDLLKTLNEITLKPSDPLFIDPTVASQFSHLTDHHLYVAEKGTSEMARSFKVGVLFSGGPAAGGHNVIAGLYDALQEMHSGSTLTGFLEGPSGFIENRFIKLSKEEIAPYRNQGGFDLLRTGRTKIETEEQFASCLKTAREHDLDAFVIIGGDDSNTNAAYLADYFLKHGLKTHVIGCPKTIDGDMTSKYIEASFGFDTAAKTYSELIGNLASDAESQGKYYFFIKLMGRSASHIVLECALQTQPNLALISEEIQAEQATLASIVDELVALVEKRAAKGLKHGVILIPEGLLEFIPECKRLLDAIALHGENLPQDIKPLWNLIPKDVQNQLMLDRDPHGNVQLSKVETERLLIELVQAKIGSKFNAQPLFFGYDGRSALPSLFDANYGYNLGRTAALLIREGKTGCMAALTGLKQPVLTWKPAAVPLLSMMAFTERKGKIRAVIEKSLVDLDGAPFHEWKNLRDKCALEDDYLMPGPIQFYGPASISDRTTKTLELSFYVK